MTPGKVNWPIKSVLEKGHLLFLNIYLKLKNPCNFEYYLKWRLLKQQLKAKHVKREA